MLRTISTYFIFALIILMTGCGSSNVTIPEGIWQGAIFRKDVSIPFLLDIKLSKNKQHYLVHVLNGSERLVMDSSYVENDSLHIPMTMFDAEIVAKVGSDKLEGVWKRYHEGREIGALPFQARYNVTYRFHEDELKPSTTTTTTFSSNEKWSTTFYSEDKADTTQAIGIFEQKGSVVTGTFLTTTGDYRYLAGYTNEDSLYLSAYDGSHLYLFRAKKKEDGSLEGDFHAGLNGFRTWKAHKDAQATLADATTLTYLKPGYETLDFSFPDMNGQMISTKDERFSNKVVVVQIMGSWCPNCMDETNFLAPWYKENKQRGVEIIGLTYEQSTDVKEVAPKIKKMIDRFDMEYPVVLAGSREKESAAKSLPALNHIMSFPTTIILDKQKKVRHIHTGFSGPGTGIYYEEFVDEFNRVIDQLLAE